jgi:hypothetical protein
VIWLQARAKLASGHGTALARVARCPVRLRKSQSEQFLAAVPQIVLQNYFRDQKCETLIQEPAQTRNLDSRCHLIGFDYCAFATQHRVLQHNPSESSRESGRPTLLPCADTVAKVFLHH